MVYDPLTFCNYIHTYLFLISHNSLFFHNSIISKTGISVRDYSSSTLLVYIYVCNKIPIYLSTTVFVELQRINWHTNVYAQIQFLCNLISLCCGFVLENQKKFKSQVLKYSGTS